MFRFESLERSFTWIIEVFPPISVGPIVDKNLGKMNMEVALRRWVLGILVLSVGSAITVDTQSGAGLVPAAGLTTWAPGVRGIPVRTQVCATVLASRYGNGRYEASEGIQAAIDACPAGQVVQLSAGIFTLNNYVLINKGITLRGAGVGTTTLQKTNQRDEQEGLVIVGPSRWPHIDETSAVNLAADAVQGAMSVRVVNAAGFAPGQFVKLDEDDYTTAQWLPMPSRLWEESPAVLATDRIVWPIHNPRGGGDLPLPGGLSWHSRAGRPLSEIKEVTAVSGNTVTFSTPVHITYTTAKAAQLVRYSGDDSAHVRSAGVEDMTLTGGSEGNVSFSSAAYSWAKNIECTLYGIPCVDITHSFRLEIRDSIIRRTIHPYPGGAGYAISLQQGTSEILIENNIIIEANKVIVVRSAGAGSVVGYNYMDDALHRKLPRMDGGRSQRESHGRLASRALRGERVVQLRLGQHATATSLAMTIFRNHLTGRRRGLPQRGQRRAPRASTFGSWWHAFIGNVIGEPGRMDGWVYEDPGDGTYGHATSRWGGRRHLEARLPLGAVGTGARPKGSGARSCAMAISTM